MKTKTDVAPQRDVPTIGAICLSAFLLGLLFVIELFSVAPGRQSIGWVAAYTLIGIAPPLVLALVEHLTTPAGPRKSAKKWLLHFQIMLANYAAEIPLGFLGNYAATHMVKFFGLSLGVIDLRIGAGKNIPSIIAGFFVNALIGDFFFY